MYTYEVIVVGVFGTDISKLVVAKSESNAKKMILDYYERMNDGYMPVVTLYNLEARKIDPLSYVVEQMLN